MADCCLLSSLFLAITVPTFMLLAGLESRKRRLLDEQRPPEDRLAEIRKDVAMVITGLRGHIDKCREEQRQPLDWIPPTIELYRRLDEMASASSKTAEEVDRFADEATRFVRERRLKGVCVGIQARRLADVVRRRNAAERSVK